MALARVNLQRFVALARAIGVARLDVLATAAMRDAADGKDFAAEIERRFDVRVRVLAGAEEGRYSALGVLSGIPDAAGVAGDLGGGSVELVPIGKGRAGPAATLPIGPLRLAAVADDERRLRDTIDRHLATVPWLDAGRRGQLLCRRRRVARAGAPPHGADAVSAAHHPAVHAGAARGREISRTGGAPVAQVTGADQHRLAQAPRGGAARGAAAAAAASAASSPRTLCSPPPACARGISTACSMRQEQRSDPLLAACAEEAQFNPRFGATGEALHAWASPLFPKEPAARQRLRRATALLSDIAWHEHPDYRAEQALRRALYMPLTGVSHAERAFIALALHTRYGGRAGVDLAVPLELLDEDALAAARTTGLAFRLGYTIAGGVPGLLGGVTLNLTDNAVVLSFTPGSAGRFGEAVQRRLDALGRAMNRGTEVRGV